MKRVCAALKTLISNYFLAEQQLTAGLNIGSKTVKVASNTYFNVPALDQMESDDRPTVLISEGKNKEYNQIDSVTGTDTITLLNNSTQNFTTNAKIIIAPGGQIYRQENISIGEYQVAPSLPAIWIVPVSKNNQWMTLRMTSTPLEVKFFAFIDDIQTERATEKLSDIANLLENILFDNLHLRVGTPTYAITYDAMIGTTQYGYVQKGSALLKAISIDWQGKEAISRLR